MTFPYRSLGFWLGRQAELAPERVALEVGERSFTFAELEDRAARCAGALAGQGVGPGDRVGALLANGPEYVETLLGCARLGAILVPMSTRLAPAELEFLANDAGIRVLVYDAELAETVKAFRPATPIE